jgi:hypothetical protein
MERKSANKLVYEINIIQSRLRLKCDGTGAETRFGLAAKRTSPFKFAGASVQSTAGSRGVRISGSNAGYNVFRGSVRVLAIHSIRQFPLHLPSRVPSGFKWTLPQNIQNHPREKPICDQSIWSNKASTEDVGSSSFRQGPEHMRQMHLSL